MIKLTKQAFADAMVGTNFVDAVHGMSLEEIVAVVKERDMTKDGLSVRYKVEAVKVRSRDFQISYSGHWKHEEIGFSYRGLEGKNEFFKEDDLLLHRNTQDGHVTIMLNM